MRYHRKQRQGLIVVLAAVLMAVCFGALALSVDAALGYLERAQMQRSADAAALAGALELLHQAQTNPDTSQSQSIVAQVSRDFALKNSVGTVNPLLAEDDLEIGLIEDVTAPYGPIVPTNSFANAVRVRVQKTNEVNGETNFHFARVFGHTGVGQRTESTAIFASAFRGFSIGSHKQDARLDILPFALDVETWNALLAGNADDNWTFNDETGAVSSGSDGILEVNLFPQDTGAPGNRGTVDIGHTGNSNADIKRQILYGISADDLAAHGGKLEFGEDGTLTLNGDTGISAAVKTQLEIIKGEPRIIPIFSAVSGNGNNANYTIIKFVGIRVMEVKLTGKMNKKRVIVQPAPVTTPWGITDTTTSNTYSSNIYSPVRIIH